MKAHAHRNSLEIIDYPNGNRVFALNGKMLATYHAQVINCACGQWIGVCKGWNYSIIGMCADRLFVRHHAAGLKTEEEARRAMNIQKRFFIKMIKDEIERTVNSGIQPNTLRPTAADYTAGTYQAHQG